MVQYDPFAQMLNGALPTRGKGVNGTETHADIARSPSQTEMPGAVPPRLRRLSQSHNPPQQFCSKCHMRRSSQNLLLTHSHSHHSEDEGYESLCPDICMPVELPRPRNHTRRHSGLCPGNLISQEHSDGRTSPTQMTVKHPSAQHSSGYNNKCHCETIIPTENLSERYGLVEEPEEIKPKRQSLDAQAANGMAEIMREEMMADMEARQPML
ncbi:hypothetical protein LTR20_002685 [Exophiala xenobiotica]|nr:hypothetical protein LTR40_007582 [Exophiala xenobiotica]KAK5327487.1 hypothetical protein LTR93_002871 [Exophiala xenobiotica]KAK5468341.1 hypothetical protein LTR20_002685 [Exophiala xenobiotica]KAK5501562.1 hypothetical protein LTR83_003242 [Exophiala xenobiotica]KAK5517900.1 hypothetical protein LTR21_002898 [Exophiala xenobiotica]